LGEVEGIAQALIGSLLLLETLLLAGGSIGKLCMEVMDDPLDIRISQTDIGDRGRMISRTVKATTTLTATATTTTSTTTGTVGEGMVAVLGTVGIIPAVAGVVTGSLTEATLRARVGGRSILGWTIMRSGLMGRILRRTLHRRGMDSGTQGCDMLGYSTNDRIAKVIKFLAISIALRGIIKADLLRSRRRMRGLRSGVNNGLTSHMRGLGKEGCRRLSQRGKDAVGSS